MRNSPLWNSIVRVKDSIEALVDCGVNYDSQWKSSFLPTLANLYSFYRISALIDPYASGVCACRSSKMAICLWRL